MHGPIIDGATTHQIEKIVSHMHVVGNLVRVLRYSRLLGCKGQSVDAAAVQKLSCPK